MLSSSRKHIGSFKLLSRSAPLGGIGLLAGALASAPAQAALSDTIHPFVSVAYSHDDNLLRLPDDTPGFAGPRGDNLTQSLAGLSLERPFGRQVLTAQAKVSRVSFDHYDELNYNGKDFQAALEWHLGNHLSGNLGGNYIQTLTPFTDSHTSERNLRTTRREFFNGAWRFHPSWQVRAAASRDKYNYDLLVQRFNDRTEDATEGGIDYLASSGSRVGLVARHLKGSYPNHRSFGGLTIDDGYTQDELKANIYWVASGITQVQLLAGWAKREHIFFANRDASGANGRVNVTWQPLGRVQFKASGWREFMAVESNLVTNSLNKGASLAATWDLAAKVKVDGQLRREKRGFNEAAGIVFPGDASDTTRYSSLGLTYNPQSFLQIGASLFHENRTGSPIAGTGSYRANGATVSITAQF